MANPWDEAPIVGDEAQTAANPWDAAPIVSQPEGAGDDEGVISWLAEGGQDIAAAFNEKLAETLGLGLSTSGRMMDPTGVTQQIIQMAFPEFDLDDPDSVSRGIKNAAGKLGIDTDAGDTLAARMGRDLFNATAIVAGFMMGGPAGSAALTGAAGSGTGVMASLARGGGELINTALRFPGTFAAGEVGAAMTAAPTGELVANTLGEEYRTVGEIGGAVVGGGAGGPTIARNAGRAVGGAVGLPVGLAADAAIGLPGPIGVVGATTGAKVGRNVANRMLTAGTTPKDALRPVTSDVAAARDFAQEAIAGDMELADQAVRQAISKVGGINDPMKKAEALRGSVRLAYARSQKEANRLWAKVDKTKLVPVNRLRHYARTITDQFREFGAENIPGDIIEKVNRLGPTEVLGGRTVRGDHASIGNLLQIRESISTQLREPHLPDTLRRNLLNIDRAIVNTIRKTYPNDKSMETASQYSLWLHNRFSRGPLGEFTGRSSRNSGFMTEPERQALRLIESEQGAQQLADASQLVPSIAGQARQMVQAEFQRMAADAQAIPDPKLRQVAIRKAHQWLGSPETRRFMRAYPQAKADLDAANMDLGAALDTQTRVNDSFLLKFSEKGPQEAVDSLWTGTGKLDRAREITSALMGDDSGRALQGLRTGMIDRLVQQSGTNPTRMKAILGQKDLRQAFTEVLGMDKMKRLDKLIDAAEQVNKGVTKGIGTRINTRLARIFGARGASLLGAKTIQGTAAGADISNFIFDAVASGPLPGKLFSMAVLDPKWERFLLSQIPANVNAIHKETDLVRALVIGLEAAERVGGVGNE